jgi:hypothetical protein
MGMSVLSMMRPVAPGRRSAPDARAKTGRNSGLAEPQMKATIIEFNVQIPDGTANRDSWSPGFLQDRRNHFFTLPVNDTM